MGRPDPGKIALKPRLQTTPEPQNKGRVASCMVFACVTFLVRLVSCHHLTFWALPSVSLFGVRRFPVTRVPNNLLANMQYENERLYFI